MPFDPGEAREHLPNTLPGVDFRAVNRVVLLVKLLSRLNRFSLREGPADWIPLRLTLGIAPPGPGFSTRWPTCLPGRESHPLEYHDLAWPHEPFRYPKPGYARRGIGGLPRKVITRA